MSNEIKNKLQQIQDLLKDIPGVHLHDIRNFVNGSISINKKNELKLPITLPVEDVLEDGGDVRNVVEGKWKMIPILMFVGD